MGFIESLQKDGLFKQEVQQFELEELQGVSGLKALRVLINFEDPVTPSKKEKRKISSRRITKRI
jgi:hypothetical protein